MRLITLLTTATAGLAIAAAPAAAEPPLRDVGPAAPDARSGRALLASDATSVA